MRPCFVHATEESIKFQLEQQQGPGQQAAKGGALAFCLASTWLCETCQVFFKSCLYVRNGWHAYWLVCVFLFITQAASRVQDVSVSSFLHASTWLHMHGPCWSLMTALAMWAEHDEIACL